MIKKYAVLVVGVLLLTGCQQEGMQDPGNAGVDAPANSAIPKLSVLTPKEMALGRAKQWWAAVIGRDYAEAYEYISPGIRSTISLEAFRGKMSVSPMLWSAVRDTGVECVSPESCRIDMEVSYIYMGGQDAARGQTMTSRLGEKWISLDGQWWLVYGQ